ncbi:MAG: hypothetical protein ACD_79C01059G0001 [uncultured bacterium]|nr:MAG: hypothetical protein ACD_79C01059G0001 [uncultured bacterium]
MKKLFNFIFLLICLTALNLSAEEAVKEHEMINMQEIKYQGEGFLRGEFLEDSEDYILGKGDVVKILVRGKAEYSGTYEVGPDGKIQFPFLDDISAEGMVKKQLQGKIIEMLESIVKSPEVSVSILKYRSKYVYILGEVNKPGKYYMTGDTIALRDAIIQAGLPTMHAALKRVHVIKPDLSIPLKKKVNMKDILYKGKLKENINLVSGDLVVVPSLIHSDINRFLNKLMEPITRVAIIDDMVDRHN